MRFRRKESPVVEKTAEEKAKAEADRVAEKIDYISDKLTIDRPALAEAYKEDTRSLSQIFESVSRHRTVAVVAAVEGVLCGSLAMGGFAEAIASGNAQDLPTLSLPLTLAAGAVFGYSRNKLQSIAQVVKNRACPPAPRRPSYG